MQLKNRKLDNRGMALVEVIVALILLALLALMVVNMLTMIVKKQARAEETQKAYMLAKEGIHKLSDTTVVAESGADTLLHLGTTYYRTWDIVTTTSPYRVDVKIVWIGDDGARRQVDFSGFLKGQNACPDIVVNKAPDSLRIMRDGAEIFQNDTDTVYVSDSLEPGTKLYGVVAVDSNIAPDGDRVLLHVVEGVNIIQPFGTSMLLIDTLIHADPTLNLIRRIIVEGQDCDGAALAQRDTFFIRFLEGAVDTVYVDDSLWSFDEENLIVGDVFTAGFGATGVNLSIVGGVLPGYLSFNGTSGVFSVTSVPDYENDLHNGADDNGVDSLYVEGTNGTAVDTGIIVFTMNPINENADSLGCNPNPLDSVVNGDDTLAQCVVHGDPEQNAYLSNAIILHGTTGDSSISVSSFLFSMIDDSTGVLRLVGTIPLEATGYTITVTLSAQDNTISPPNMVTRSVAIPVKGSSGGFASTIPDWVSSSYSKGDVVQHGGIAHIASITGAWGDPEPPAYPWRVVVGINDCGTIASWLSMGYGEYSVVEHGGKIWCNTGWTSGTPGVDALWVEVGSCP